MERSETPERNVDRIFVAKDAADITSGAMKGTLVFRKVSPGLRRLSAR